MKKAKDVYIAKKKSTSNISSFILKLVIFLIIITIIHLFFFKIYELKNPVNNKNYIFIINIFNKKFNKFDEVLAHHPYNENILIFGKILAVGPETIKIQKQEIKINDEVLKNPFPENLIFNQDAVLKEREYFIHSNESIDSLYIGKIPENLIIGKIIYKF